MLSSLDKMLLYAKAFVKVKYKSSGPELGKFVFNHIYLDDRNWQFGMDNEVVWAQNNDDDEEEEE